MRRSTARLRTAIAAEAATAERERLARDIHDGVLQVLAFVRRRGDEAARADPEGPVAELARLAGEQEVALRRLMTSAAPVTMTATDHDTAAVDLSAALGAVLPARATLAAPADPVRVPAPTAETLAAVIREAAANAAEHAPGASLWVLVEDGDDAVTVSVRDDGPGIPHGRLVEAEAAGHLGVASSMRGRVEALDGTMSLHTGPGQGTEWEITVSRDRVGGRR
jgi:signal transduction histidine kinase